MFPIVSALLACLTAWLRSRRSMQLEILALRHQLAVYQRSVPRPRIRPIDRLLWAWLARLWSGWQAVLAFVQPPHGHRLAEATFPRVLAKAVPAWQAGTARHLKRLLTEYVTYYHRFWRFWTHLSLAMDCPETRAIEPPETGRVSVVPEVGGLHHHYERRAA
jgi:hypothetical protein